MENRQHTPTPARKKGRDIKLSLYTYGKEPACVHLAQKIRNIEDPKVRGNMIKAAGKIMGNSRGTMKAFAESVVMSITTEGETIHFKRNSKVQAAIQGYMSMRLHSLRNTNLPAPITASIFRALKEASKTYLKISKELEAQLTEKLATLAGEFTEIADA